MKRLIISKELLKKWKKPALVALIVVLSLILVAVVGVAIAGSYVLDKLGSAQPTETFSVIPPEFEDFETDGSEDNWIDPEQNSTNATGETNDPEGTGTATDPTETTEPTEPTPPPTRPNFAWPEVERLQSGDVMNILLIGQDSDKATGQRSRSDTMILLSLNKKANTITMTSFMRDLYVQIPGGYSDNRINAAYRFGGAPLLDATIEKNFGVVIDGNVEVGFDQFAKIIDILGGVDVELTKAEAKYMQARGYMFQAGKCHLNGAQALMYCRIRSIDSDHYRTERQRKVLGAIAESARSMSVGQMLELINKVLPYVYTDLSDSEVISCATSGLSILAGGGKVQSGKVPQNGQYYGSNIMGMQVMVPNLPACNQYLKTFIYGS